MLQVVLVRNRAGVGTSMGELFYGIFIIVLLFM